MYTLLGKAFETVKYNLWSKTKQVESQKVLKPDVQQLTIKYVITKDWLNKEAKELKKNRETGRQKIFNL